MTKAFIKYAYNFPWDDVYHNYNDRFFNFQLFFFSLVHDEDINNDDFAHIERFVVLLYDRSSTCIDVNSCRRDLFSTKQRDVESIPPTRDALKQHLLRAMLQAM